MSLYPNDPFSPARPSVSGPRESLDIAGGALQDSLKDSLSSAPFLEGNDAYQEPHDNADPLATGHYALRNGRSDDWELGEMVSTDSFYGADGSTDSPLDMSELKLSWSDNLLRARYRAQDLGAQVQSQIQARPFMALGVVIGAGILVGYLLRTQRRKHV